ncbi:DUF58 domain-containing protein [Paenibacillus glufosinatiresistens]|uniref:DUF58 domain-containing protein n=1 Tax=Paenibacillus glufosinatiresistens TaxID=3070657 RepID=UPI00286E5D67|nr:DUF58 domain-containing protein [Paenibacillus sp. YX.27]
MRSLLAKAAASVQPAKLAAMLAVWVVTLLYVLFQGGKNSVMLFTMATILILYLLTGGLLGVRRAKGVRTLLSAGDSPEPLAAGGYLQVRLRLNVPGILPLPYLVVREMLKKHNGESWKFEDSLIPDYRGRSELRFQTPPLERGIYTFQETEIGSIDVFGLVEHKGSFLAEGRFRVLPRTVYLPRWNLYERSSRRSGLQTSLAQSRRESVQINGVRDYVYGDRLSRIHWNATARTGAWKSKEFEHESVPRTMVVLDGTARVYSNSAQFELAVSAAASLLGFGLRERIGVGLCAIDREIRFFAPAEGAADRRHMTHALIDLNAEGSGRLLEKLEKSKQLFPRGCHFVFVSPQSGGAALEVLRWAENRGMMPVHLHVRNPASPGRYAEWAGTLDSCGMAGYSVAALEELPAALEGREAR